MDKIENLLRSKKFSVNNILKYNAYNDKPLDFDTAYLLGIFTLYPYKNELSGLFSENKKIAEKQSIAALCALHDITIYSKDGAAEQIAGIVAAIFDYDIRISKNGFLKPDVDLVMDNCGMGGDFYRTPNVSTIAALIAAADGIKMCKHGSPGNTDCVGSSDFLKFCGVNLYPKKETVEKALKEVGFGYTDATDTRYKMIHVQTHKSAHLAHMNDIIGPITNPVDPRLMKKRVVGVNHLLNPKVIAEAYKILNEKGITSVEHALIVRGFVTKDRDGGMDEVSICPGGTRVAELRGKDVIEYDLHASDFGLSEILYDDIKKELDKNEKRVLGVKILQGEASKPVTDLVIANAAILEYLANGVSFKEGAERARESIKRAKEKLEEYNDFVEKEERK